MFEEDGSLTVSYSFYNILDIKPPCTDDQLLKAYRKQALKYHPDKLNGCPERFKKIKEAHEFLKDPLRRDFYNRFGDKGVSTFLSNDIGTQLVFNTSTWFGRYALRIVTRPIRLIPIFFFFAFIGLCIVLFLNFVDRKLYNAGLSSMSWPAVFSLFWFVYLVFIAFVGLYVFVILKNFKQFVTALSYSDEFVTLPAPRKRLICFLSAFESAFMNSVRVLVSLVFIYCQIILTLNMDSKGNILNGSTWQAIFDPFVKSLFFFSMASIVFSPVLMFRMNNPKRLKRKRALFLFHDIYSSICLFGFSRSLLSWLDSSNRLNFELLQTFSWIYFQIFLWTLKSLIVSEWANQDLEDKLIFEADSSSHDDIRRRLSIKSKWGLVINFVSAVILFITVYLPQSHMMGHWPHSWSMAFFPVLLVIFVFMFIFGILLPCVVTCMDLALPIDSFDKYYPPGEEGLTVIDIFSLYPFGYALAPFQPRISY
jgi:hypothetical protein